jgi:hypothetical protein
MRLLKSIFKLMPLRSEFFDNRLLRISPRSALNDPYDFYPFSSDLVPQKIYVAVGKGHIFEEPRNPQDHLNGTGVISFTEVIDNILMWSHYGDSHKGMAIEFDPKHSFFTSIQRVRYTSQRPNLRQEYPEIMAPELYFKSDQWMYEKEWRLVKSNPMRDCIWNTDTKSIDPVLSPSSSLSPSQLLMSRVPAEAIRSVTFGCMVGRDEIDQIISAIMNIPELTHLQFKHIELNPDRYELVIKSIPPPGT